MSEALAGLLFDETVSGLPPVGGDGDGDGDGDGEGREGGADGKANANGGDGSDYSADDYGESPPKSGYALLAALLLVAAVGAGAGVWVGYSKHRGASPEAVGAYVHSSYHT